MTWLMVRLTRIVSLTLLALVILTVGSVVVAGLVIRRTYRLVAVDTDAMRPAVPKGSLALVRPMADYQIGDIIAFYAHPTTKTILVRRIVAKSVGVFRVAADTSIQPDLNLVLAETIIGKVHRKFAKLGYVIRPSPPDIIHPVATALPPPSSLLTLPPPPIPSPTPTAAPLAGRPVINEVAPAGETAREWVEIYNPTTGPIQLTGWKIADGQETAVLPPTPPLPAGQIAVIVPRGSQVSGLPAPTLLITLSDDQIGNGLDDAGDRILLTDPANTLVDQLSYGQDTTVFPFPPLAPTTEAYSIARFPSGADTDLATDWLLDKTPSPGESN